MDDALAWEALPALFPALEAPGRWLALLRTHAALLEAAAPAVRTSAVEGQAAVRRQYAECLELLRIVRERQPGGPWADVGSGGGFPGLVVAIAEPETAVVLVEPLQKRARLLAELAESLGLANVSVAAQRAEEAGRGSWRDACAVVSARAVAPLPELLEYTAPLAAAGGLLALPKGSGLAAERASAVPALEALGCEEEAAIAMRPEVSSYVTVWLGRKPSATDARYPRRAGVPARRPL
jgi:16S rRNA (guanine527-N7)-methyltransferase